jgi:hypothetical protein
LNVKTLGIRLVNGFRAVFEEKSRQRTRQEWVGDAHLPTSKLWANIFRIGAVEASTNARVAVVIFPTQQLFDAHGTVLQQLDEAIP